MANLQPAMLDVPEGAWPGGGLSAPVDSSLPNLSVYLHALRRRWMLAVALGFLSAAMVAPAVWFSFEEKYTSKSYLQIASANPKIVFETDYAGRGLFDVYKSTQQQLVTSPFVITAALRKPEVAKLRCVQEEIDPVAWAAQQLKVTFPGDAEIMMVGLTGKNPEEVTTLVRAVVDAYVDEVVNVERNQKRHLLSERDRVYTDKETEIRSKQTNLSALAKQLGTDDTEALSKKQQIALEEFAVFRNQLIRQELISRQAHGELKAKRAMLDEIDKEEVSEFELQSVAQTDPIAQQMLSEIAWRRSDSNYNSMIAVPGNNSSLAQRQQRELQLAQQQYDRRVEELREEIRHKKRAALEQDIQRIETAIAISDEQVTMLREDVDRQRKEAERFGGSSIDIEMMRDEIERNKAVLAGIASEREKLAVELRSPSRITLIQRAEEPKSPDRDARLPITVFAALLALCFPIGLVAWWDSRAGRINTASEVSKGMGLPVIGAIPVIPTRAIRQLGGPSKSHLNWHTRLTESADSIAARLLRKAELEGARVVLITSAMGGEGKTTLATQLAMSLARSEHSAVLVDFDLRRPAFDEIFGLPLKPGVSEFLRGECGVDEVTQRTSTNDLTVVTAGRWDRQALTALANGAAGSLFEKLRAEYEFILVDASPVLPVADTRFVSQHVDAVILSVLRDVSQAPKINAACDILRAFGVRILEAVVTGPSEGGRYKDLGYEPRLPT
jgi:capsular exopolysaccharide synthesis family protein